MMSLGSVLGCGTWFFLIEEQLYLTKVQQRSAARCACATAAEDQRPKGGALTPQAARRDGHPPWGRWHDDGFFPGRRLVFLPVPRKDLRPLARPHEVAPPALRQTLSACLRHLPRISGHRPRGHSKPFGRPCRGERLHHAHASSRFCGMRTAWWRATQPLSRSCSRRQSAHQAEASWTSHDLRRATTLPRPGTAQELSAAIPDPVVHREGPPGS
jgi:hypothetical protein